MIDISWPYNPSDIFLISGPVQVLLQGTLGFHEHAYARWNSYGTDVKNAFRSSICQLEFDLIWIWPGACVIILPR